MKIITACKEVEIPLYVDYRRAMPRFVKIKDLLEQKAIGDVHINYTVSESHGRRKGFEIFRRVQPELADGRLFLI